MKIECKQISGQGKARQGKARQGKARQGKASKYYKNQMLMLRKPQAIRRGNGANTPRNPVARKAHCKEIRQLPALLRPA
ncbi:MAG: hypothetical protein FWF20_01465 [Betaproteobacteria bacterium]|nr:hypothetical protein [Betaproteobacteria bacterium]MCL2885450.1 hypothetical protein [Betaproteobacteria bacterium]